MAYKPNSIPLIDKKRSKIVEAFELEIDKHLEDHRGSSETVVLLKGHWDLYNDPSICDKWLWDELVSRYKKAGWKFVTVYLNADPHYYVDGTQRIRGYDKRTQDLQMFFSQEYPLTNEFSKSRDFGQLFFLRRDRYEHVSGDGFCEETRGLPTSIVVAAVIATVLGLAYYFA